MLILATISAVAACGTTVPVAQGSYGAAGGTVVTGTGDGLQGTPAADAVPGAVGSVEGAVAGVTRVPGPSSSVATAQPGAVAGPGSVEAGAAATATGRKAPVEIGIQTVDIGDGVAAVSAAGNCDASCAANYKGVNQETMAKAVAEWANARGGLAGHPIKLVNYNAKVSDALARGGAAVAAEACQKWTEDHDVVALVLPNGVTDDWYACAVKHRLPVINTDFANYVPDRQELKGNGVYNYASANFNLDDTAKYYVSALADQGFLTAKNKVGLITKESTIYARVIKNVLQPELARRGIELVSTAEWNDSTQQNAWNQYVLNFRSKDVDRVLVFGGYNFGMANFAKTAETQSYRPRYGVSSIAGPNEMVINGVPPAQLEGAQGVGWWPFADVATTGDAATFNPKAAECKKIMKEAGQPWQSGVWLMELKFCDAIFLLKTLADRAGVVDARAFYDAADSLGTSYVSPYVWKTHFRRGDHNAAVYLRDLAYDGACRCFRYTAPMYLPRW